MELEKTMKYDKTSTDWDNTKICDTEYGYGGHAFVWAKPIKHDWKYYDNSALKGSQEYRPVRVFGHGQGMRVEVFGNVWAHPMEDFEFTYEVK